MKKRRKGKKVRRMENPYAKDVVFGVDMDIGRRIASKSNREIYERYIAPMLSELRARIGRRKVGQVTIHMWTKNK